MNKKREPSSLATIVLATALSITLGACVIGVSETAWPHLTAAMEAMRFAP